MSPKSLMFSRLLLPTRSPATPPYSPRRSGRRCSALPGMLASRCLPTPHDANHRRPSPFPSRSTAVVPVAPGAAVRLTVAKVKEVVEVGLIVEKLSAATASSGEARGAGVSFGENFMVAVFDSVEELGAVEEDGKVEEAKDAVRVMLDEVVVLDFVVGDAPAATIL